MGNQIAHPSTNPIPICPYYLISTKGLRAHAVDPLDGSRGLMCLHDHRLV